MKHHLSYLLTFFLFVSAANAQNTNRAWRIGFGIDPGIPANKPFKYALGGDIRLQKQFSDRVAGTLTVGFSHYFEKDHFADFLQYSTPFNVIPVKAGIRLFLDNNLYLGGEAGAGFGLEEWGTSFLWSPSVGLAFKNGFDVSLKYEDYTRNSATRNVALRLAYGIDIRELIPHRKSNAIHGMQLGIGLNPGLLTNTFDNLVIGADISLKKRVSTNLEALISTGLTHYSGNYYNYDLNTSSAIPVVQITKTDRNVIPLQTGIRLYAGDQFYVGAQAGAAFGLSGTTTLIYTPSLGLSFQNGFEIGARYDNYSSLNIRDVLSLKLGYNFKL